MTRIRERASKVHGLCVIRLIRVIGGDVGERSGSGDRIITTAPSSRSWSPLGGPIECTADGADNADTGRANPGALGTHER